MKITFLVTTIDSAAGTERAIITQANSLVASGTDVEIHSVYRITGETSFPLNKKVAVYYWLDQDPETEHGGNLAASDSAGYRNKPSRLIPVSWDNQFSLLTDVAAGQILPVIDADILVTTTPALGLLAGSLANPEIVVVAQEHRASMRRGSGFEPLRRAAMQIDCIVSLTDASNEWLGKELVSSGVRLETIPNVLPEVFRPQSTTGQKMIIAAGRLAPGKQFGQLIDAFSRVSAGHPDWTLRIYGNGPLEESLKNQAVRLNIAHAVEIVPPVKNLELEWPKGSILALTSRMEGLPLVIMEAAGAGVPTVSYDCQTGPAELIVDGVSGVLVPLNNVASMAMVLDKLMGDDPLRLRMGQAAKQLIGNYSPARIDAMWQGLYTDLFEEAERIPGRSARSIERYAKSLQDAEVLDAGEEPIAKVATEPAAGTDLTVLEPAGLGYDQVLLRNRQSVERLLHDADVRYRELEGYHGFRSVFAVPEDDREAFLGALREVADPALAVEMFAGATSLRARRWSPALEEVPPALQEATMLRIYGRYGDVHGLIQVGTEAAVEIEFWAVDEDEPGPYLAPRHNRVLDAMEESDFSASDGSAAAGRNIWSQINFPIDVVYTWVDGADPVWRARKTEHLPEASAAHDQATSDARFTNRDELRYSIRSLRRYAPWVRNIFLVTDDQVPAWLAEDSEIKVVSHRDLFPDAGSLPTFNSHAIETTLHRIPGLAEHFLYCNDDTVLLRLQGPDSYFTPNGLAKFFPSPVKINYLSGENEPHIAAAINNREIIRERFGMEITQSMLHTPHPHRKSVLAIIEEEQQEAVESTRSHRFRDPSDISLLSSLGQYYGYGLEKYIQGSIRYTYVGLGRPETESRLLGVLNSSRLDVATFGESNLGYDDPEETDRQLRQFFETKFSLASRDERIEPLDEN